MSALHLTYDFNTLTFQNTAYVTASFVHFKEDKVGNHSFPFFGANWEDAVQLSIFLCAFQPKLMQLLVCVSF